MAFQPLLQVEYLFPLSNKMMVGVSRDSPEFIVQVSGGEEGPAGKALTLGRLLKQEGMNSVPV